MKKKRIVYFSKSNPIVYYSDNFNRGFLETRYGGKQGVRNARTRFSKKLRKMGLRGEKLEKRIRYLLIYGERTMK